MDLNKISGMIGGLSGALSLIAESPDATDDAKKKASDGLKLLDGLEEKLASTAEGQFIHAVNVMARRVHDNATAKGFWPPERSDSEAIALIHSEASEWLEELRLPDGSQPSPKVPEFTEEELEFADVVIRCFDLAVKRGLRAGEAIIAKHRYNLTRPYKHGKKF